MLAMIEDDFHPGRDLTLATPVPPSGRSRTTRPCARPSSSPPANALTALELQWELYDLGRKYAAERGLEALGDEEVGRRVLDRWEAVLHGLESDPPSLARQLDWVAKLRLIEAYRERHDLDWGDPKLAALDLQYHDLRPAKSLFARLAMERLTDDDEVTLATSEPPLTTTRPTSAAGASSGSPPPSWPPTGTRSCSTWVRIRCAVCP